MTSSAAALALGLMLSATPGMAQSGPAPYAVTPIIDGDAPACSLRGPQGAAPQLEFVQHTDDRLFLAFVSPTWRLGAASQGRVVVHSRASTKTVEFRSVSPTRMAVELDWDRSSDYELIQNILGSADVEVSFPSGNSVHMPGPDSSSGDALDRCVSDQKRAHPASAH